MLINGTHYRSIWLADDARSVGIIDQRKLPFEVEIEYLRTYREVVAAIRDMHLRGAPLIGAAAGYGVYLACMEFAGLTPDSLDVDLARAIDELDGARPTAVNLHWALERQRGVLAACSSLEGKVLAALETANAIADEDVQICAALGRHGADILEKLCAAKYGKTVQILTHCNAGWLATVDHGTVTAGIYEAARRGVPLHVWVDETRPRNQGALTSWELTQNGIANTVVCDNAGGHLMQAGQVDVVIVGTDRTARNGDVANKIGTYLKALAAHDNGIPFYVALPSPTYDPVLPTGMGNIPIEERDPAEVLGVRGRIDEGRVEQARVEQGREGPVPGSKHGASRSATVSIYAEGTKAANPAFDVTPARLVTGYITEKGIFNPGTLAVGLGAGLVPGLATNIPADTSSSTSSGSQQRHHG
jgi:methylthioribose-1-phosphate isomerase